MIEKFKAYWSLLRETHGYILRPRRIGRLLDRLYAYREYIGDMDAAAWESRIVQNLQWELDTRKAAMDEEEQAHEETEAELRKEIAALSKQLAEAKAERASALAEKAYLLAEKTEWLKEGDPNRVPSETAPSDC